MGDDLLHLGDHPGLPLGDIDGIPLHLAGHRELAQQHPVGDKVPGLFGVQGIVVTCLLARAYINLDDPQGWETALALLQSVAAEGKEDPDWWFRTPAMARAWLGLWPIPTEHSKRVLPHWGASSQRSSTAPWRVICSTWGITRACHWGI